MGNNLSDEIPEETANANSWLDAFTIDGTKVSGSGTFTEAGRQAQGRFEVDC